MKRKTVSRKVKRPILSRTNGWTIIIRIAVDRAKKSFGMENLNFLNLKVDH